MAKKRITLYQNENDKCWTVVSHLPGGRASAAVLAKDELIAHLASYILTGQPFHREDLVPIHLETSIIFDLIEGKS